MAIESKAAEHEKTDEYPKLMVSNLGKIVLFDESNCGMLLGYTKNHNYSFKIGYYSEAWIISDFTDYHGTVTLSNK